jgi:outer membrane protein assembly factor BamB/tetratricopeptide (TPR) repeat protein
MIRIRRFALVVLSAALPLAVAFPQDAPKPTEYYSAITLIKNGDAQKLIAAAEDLLQQARESADDDTRAEILSRAASALLSLLEVDEDAFVELRRKGPDGKETVRTAGIRAEAHRLVSSLPPEGKQYYELLAGQKAKAQLARARAQEDVHILGDIVQRYPYTEASSEALNLLGTYHLERHRYDMAAICFDRLLKQGDAARLPVRALFKAALVFYRAGNRTQGDQAWKLLVPRIEREGGLKLGEKVLDVDGLRQLLDAKAAAEQQRRLADWGLYRGSACRDGRGAGAVSDWTPRWSVSTVPTEGACQTWVENALRAVDDTVQRKQPVLPGFFPVAVQRPVKDDGDRLIDQGMVVYRSFEGLHAVELQTGKLVWWTALDSFNREVMGNNQNRVELERWQQTYQSQNLPGIPFENSVIGSLSTDESRAFVVDDLPLPYSPTTTPHIAVLGLQAVNAGNFTPMLERNNLKAYNLVTGKILWELGGEHQADKRLQNSFFSGPPLPLDGKLYVLNEQASVLRLICLQCLPDARVGERVEVVWIQPLATLKERLLLDVNRHIQAAHLAYRDGILVCPTNAGAVLGIDLLSRSLVWSHDYREGTPAAEEPPQQIINGRVVRVRRPIRVTINVNPSWKNTAPIIQNGRVIVAAPDGAGVHCLNLRDGRLLWAEKRGADDLYLAGVYQDRVVIVGKNHCRAVDLGSGKALWRIEGTGLPSGQGLAHGGIFYLPLRDGAESHEPEICAIDVTKGAITGRIKALKNDVPGNLIGYQGMVLSQTLNGVTAYPQAGAEARP